MNVSTSANWSRPAVGIVRVEQAIWTELAKFYGGDRFKLCVWDGSDFVEWRVPVDRASGQKRCWSPFEADFPQSKSFDLLGRLSGFFKKSSGHSEATISPTPDRQLISIDSTVNKPRFGDILISVGLDWDHSYSDAFYRLKTQSGVSVITCCYDLIPVLFPQYCVGEVAAKFKEYFTKLTWGSSAVLCISAQTKRDYERLCLSLGTPTVPTHIIPLGDNLPTATGRISLTVKNVCVEPFLLFVSTIERRKNHEILYRAYHLLCREGHRSKLPKLVFVGMPGWGVNDFLKDVELDPLTTGLIIQLNHVNDAELEHLYQNAQFCVYPSLYEGWGLPVGEALAMGKAVVASDQGSLPEVGGNLVRYVDPWNAQAWADVLLDLLDNPEKIVAMEAKTRASYRVRAWSDTSRVVRDVIDQIDGERLVRIELEPGYDLQPATGVPCGPSIQSDNQTDGLLLSGPHRSLPSGKYKLELTAKVPPDEDGEIEIYAVSASRSVTHANERLNLTEIAKFGNARNQFLHSMDFSSASFIEDFEILVFCRGFMNVSIEYITISQTS